MKVPVWFQGLLLCRNDQEKRKVGRLEFVTKHDLSNATYLMAIFINRRVFRNDNFLSSKENKTYPYIHKHTCWWFHKSPTDISGENEIVKM